MGQKKKKKAGKDTYFHQLNGRKLSVVFVLAIGEGRTADLQPDLEFDNFKRHPKRIIL
jgi:hypothetical protein